MLRPRHFALPVAAALVSFFAVAAPAQAVAPSYTWIGNSGNSGGDNHSWSDSTNWTPQGVPSDGASVTIAPPDSLHCTVRIDNGVPTATLTSLTLSSGPDAGCGSAAIVGGAITVTGTFSWDGGTVDTPLTIAAGATGAITATNNKPITLNQEIDVNGTLTLSGLSDARPGGANTALFFNDIAPHTPRVHIASGGTLDSDGSNEVEAASCCNAPAHIVNDGTLSLSAGDFTVHGVEVDQNATLSASSNGRLISDGTPNTAADGATYSGSGSWLVEDGASVTMSGTQTIGSGFGLELGGVGIDANATLNGTATLTGAGEFDWTGGTVAGDVTIAHGMSVHVYSSHVNNGKQALDGQSGNSAFTNHGSVTIDEGAGLFTENLAELVNASDGTLSLAPGTQLTTLGCCVNPNKIVNRGAVIVPAGTSTDPVVLDGVAYQASGGTTSIASGRVLQVDKAPSSLASTTVSAGGTLTVAAPTAVSGTSTIGSGTKLDLANGGSLNGTATIGGGGSLQWTGGAFSGNVTVTTGGGVAVSGADKKYVANIGGGSTGSKLTLKTHTSIAAGTSADHDYLGITNPSTLTLASSTTVGSFTEIYSGKLVNTGTLTVKPGASGKAVRSGPLTNKGTVTVSSGTFEVDDNYVQSAGTTTIAGGAKLSNLFTSRTITLNGGVLQGTGTVNEGVTNNAGTVQPADTGNGTLHVTGSFVQGRNGVLALTLGATSRDLLAVKGAVTLHGKLTAHNVGSYHPHLGAKFKPLSAASLVYSLNCATTSGTGSQAGHWAASHTGAGVYVTWRSGAHTHC